MCVWCVTTFVFNLWRNFSLTLSCVWALCIDVFRWTKINFCSLLHSCSSPHGVFDFFLSRCGSSSVNIEVRMCNKQQKNIFQYCPFNNVWRSSALLSSGHISIFFFNLTVNSRSIYCACATYINILWWEKKFLDKFLCVSDVLYCVKYQSSVSKYSLFQCSQ